jgi:hypothetical protein
VEPGALRVAGLETAGVPGPRSADPTGRDRVTASHRGEAAARGGGSAHGAKPDRPGKPAEPKPSKPKPVKPRPAKPTPDNAKSGEAKAKADQGGKRK